MQAVQSRMLDFGQFDFGQFDFAEAVRGRVVQRRVVQRRVRVRGLGFRVHIFGDKKQKQNKKNEE